MSAKYNNNIQQYINSIFRKSWLSANQQLLVKKKKKRLLDAQNLILIANVFQESKMFHQTVFSLFVCNTQEAYFFDTSCYFVITSNFFAPIAALYNNMRP